MHPENENDPEGIIIHQDTTLTKKARAMESNTLSINTTSTPATTLNDKIVVGNSTQAIPPTTTTTVHSPSLLPVSVQWLGQNPNLLGKFLEYYKVITHFQDAHTRAVIRIIVKKLCFVSISS